MEAVGDECQRSVLEALESEIVLIVAWRAMEYLPAPKIISSKKKDIDIAMMTHSRRVFVKIIVCQGSQCSGLFQRDETA